VKVVLIQLPLRASAATQNWARIRCALERRPLELHTEDVVVLPELLDLRPERAAYEESVSGLARDLGCHVVGGSHYERRGDAKLNSGVVAHPSGRIVGRYEKQRPYGTASDQVMAGATPGELTIAGRRVLVVVCADFWFSDVFQRLAALPDLVLVPACSVTRKPTPRFARALWRHMAVARAYEYGTFVAISDWARASSLPGAPGAVAGFADPTRTEPRQFFSAVGREGLAAHVLDFAALDRFRADRSERRFLWHPASRESIARPWEAPMSLVQRFLAYAAAFEQAFHSDDWSVVEPFFTEDAVYHVALDPPFGGYFEGRAAILAYFKDVLDRLDRRFETRKGELLEAPRLEGERVVIRGRVVYRAPGVPDAVVEVEEIAHFTGDRIRQLEDRYAPETRDQISEYLAEHGGKLGIH